jgi:hypothetical protein|tara:strand:- start:636 stop:839 length:204 start_codon:yes stop_codon:yes gene_type:complete
MVLLDASDILILRDAKMDDWKEWIITIILLPVFILGFIVLYIIMVATVLMAMFIEWYNTVPLPRSKK